MKRAFSIIELIMTIVIMGILAGGAYISLAKLYSKSARTKAISDLSEDSTRISNQITQLLSYRIPASVIGYDSSTGEFESIYNITKNYSILEWISVDYDAYKDGKYSGFVDFDDSNKDENNISSPVTPDSSIFGDRALVFSGSFDEGVLVYSNDFNDSFGWHNHNHTKLYEINTTASNGQYLVLNNKPDTIYEKYSLVKEAYAVARYGDINSSAQCIKDLHLDSTLGEKSLFLFYNYKPWNGETFCADPQTNGTRDGNVTLLSNNSGGFTIDFIDGGLQFNLSLTKVIHKPGKDMNITISKQKVVY